MRFIKDILRDIRARQNLDVYITVAIAVIVAVLGVVGVAGSAIISSAILAVLSMVSIWLVQSRRESDEIRLALARTGDLQRRLEDLAAGLGTKVTFVPTQVGQYAAVAQDLAELVLQASQELLVLDYVPLEEGENKVLYLEEDKMTPWRRRYYDIIEEKVRNGRGKFRYRRIIQVPQGRQVADLLVDDPILREHCETIVGFGEKLPEIASIKRCDTVYHDTFIIIDRRILILSIFIADPDDRFYYDCGYLLFDEPFEKVIGHFLRFFERTDAQAILVRSTDLSE